MLTTNLQINMLTQEVPSINTIESCFRKIPKNYAYFQIWKVNDDNLETCTKQQFGTFIDDCAYIIYAACLQGDFVTQDTIIREIKSKGPLERYIHFWLGDNVSEKKRSNAASKIQELDTYLNNTATEYREAQNNESARFLSYFKNGIIIKCGLLINSPDETRLYQLHGRKWLYCHEMKSISWEHFGADYIMMLNTTNQLFVWIGRSSSNVERHNAIELAMKFRNSPDQITIVDDGYEQLMLENEKAEWNKFLPLNMRVVCQNSLNLEKSTCTKTKMYKCCFRDNRLHVDQLDVIVPTKEDLSDSNAVYIVDAYSQGVWMWVGSLTSHLHKVTAMGNGRAFVKKKKYPNNTAIIRVMEGYEPTEFVKLFPTWCNDLSDSQLPLKLTPTNLGKFDSLTLCQRPKMAADTQLIDDGTGERNIFHITKDQIIDVTALTPKYFVTTSSYVIQYAVNINSMSMNDVENVGVNEVIYQWNGVEASPEIISKAEKFARNLFDTSEKSTMFVQMSEPDETPHFLQIFHGKLIILRNEKNLRYYSNNNSETTRDICILKVYGDASYNGKAVEVFPLITNMNSKECYIIQTVNHVWIWCGQNSTGDAREISKTIGSTLGEHTLLLEHKESKEFWNSVTNIIKPNIITNESQHNNCNHANISPLSSISSRHTNSGNNSNTSSRQCLSTNCKPKPQVQLFLVWAQRGKFFSQEIIGFDQTDLSPECVYILDASSVIYVWLGKYVSTYENEKYLSIAQNYFETVPRTRRPTIAIAIVRQNNEPNIFKGFFNKWNHDHWQNYVSYVTKRHLMSKNSSGKNCPITSAALLPALLNNQKDFDRHQKYPIAVLQQDIDFLPAEINPLKRELHLTHDDFVSLFNMSFWEFDELPIWKQHELKKKCKLF